MMDLAFNFEEEKTMPAEAAAEGPQPKTVTELSNEIKRFVEGNFGRVLVRGEIFGAKRADSGHWYLSLKDENAVLSAVCWRGVASGLEVKIEDGLEVRANPTDLARAVQNMIVNAGKYGRSSDGILRLSITLRYLKKRGAAELIVADDGKGLPESDLERVLRPFERGDTARGNASGTGLGLSIVNRVAKAGGGSVRLAQNIPNGLSVQMTIPVVPKASVVRKLTEGKETPEKAD